MNGRPGIEIYDLTVWVTPLRRYLAVSEYLMRDAKLEFKGLYTIKSANYILIDHKHLSAVIQAIELIGGMYRVKEEYQPRFEDKFWRDTNGVIPLKAD